MHIPCSRCTACWLWKAQGNTRISVTFLHDALVQGQQGLIVGICKVAVAEEQLCGQAPGPGLASQDVPQRPGLPLIARLVVDMPPVDKIRGCMQQCRLSVLDDMAVHASLAPLNTHCTSEHPQLSD